MVFRRSPPWDEVVYWSLDLETSGLDASRDRMLSVGMVPVRRGAVRWGERFYSLVHPGSFSGLTEEAITVHHILPQELRSAPPVGEVLDAIANRLRDAVLLVHHASLDVRVLAQAHRQLGRRWKRPPVVDTRNLLARLEHRLQQLEPYAEPFSRSLGGVREQLGLPAYDYHHALTDALATAELFLVLRSRLGARKLRQLT